MDWSPDGRFIAFIANDVLYLWNPASPSETRTIGLHTDAIPLAFAPNGRWLATCSGNYVTIFEISK
jgi:WD40 repeat protein